MATIPGVYDLFNAEFEKFQGIYLISDTHFCEEDIKKAFPNRPSDDELVKRINSQVGSRDLLIHLGDVGDPSCIQQLKADCWLICGNHDKGVMNYQRNIFNKIYDKDKFSTIQEVRERAKLDYPEYKITNIEENHQFIAPFDFWKVTFDNKLFNQIFEGPVMLGEKILLSHEPVLAVPWCLDIHGHNHQGPRQSDCYHYNVALEINDYKPTNLKQLVTSGVLSRIETLHRTTIDGATTRARKRGYTLKEKIEK